MNTPKFGDIWMLRAPLASGTATKRRPVVLVSAEEWSRPDGLINYVAITSAPSRLTTPDADDITVENWRECGLDRASAIQSRRIGTTQGRYLFARIGALTPQQAQQLRALISGFFAV